MSRRFTTCILIRG
uniref:Uncharacterized protein n=1 Tax=Arundo donax TaxID=35708 RepID=A0A0A9FLI8_ARUDO